MLEEDPKEALLSISCGNRNFTSDLVAKSIETLIKRHGKIKIGLYDTLRRHHYQYLGNDQDVARKEALLEGDRWLKKNKDILEKYKDNITLYRYDEFKALDSDLYDQSGKHLELFYNSEAGIQFKESVCDGILSLWNARVQRGQEKYEEIKPDFSKLWVDEAERDETVSIHFLRYSFKYVFDELAAANSFWHHNPNTIDYYFGDAPDFLTYISKLPSAPEGLEGLWCHKTVSLLSTEFNLNAASLTPENQFITKPTVPVSVPTTSSKLQLHP